MQPQGLSEDELFMFIAGRLDPAVLSGAEPHLAIARAIAAAIVANNRRVGEQQQRAQQRSRREVYDALSQNIDCY